MKKELEKNYDPNDFEVGKRHNLEIIKGNEIVNPVELTKLILNR